MKNILFCLLLIGVAAQAQKKQKPLVLTPIDALQGTAFEKMKQAFIRLNIPYTDAIIAENVAKMERNNAWFGQPDKNFNIPVLRLCVYIDEEKAKWGITTLNKGLGDWVTICEVHKAFAQSYFTNPKTKKRMVLFSYFVPQSLVPDYEGYIPTVKELEKITNPNEREPAKWGFLFYRKASTATKKACKAR